MPFQTIDLPRIVATSSGKTVPVGGLDDASSITIYLTSSATGSSGAVVQVSQFDPLVLSSPGVSQSTFWVTAATVTSSNTAVVLTNVSFRGLRLVSSSTAFTANEVVAYIAKQIQV